MSLWTALGALFVLAVFAGLFGTLIVRSHAPQRTREWGIPPSPSVSPAE